MVNKMLKLPGFRKWFHVTEDVREKIESMIDDGEYILFFKKDGNIFAASEDSRVAFAKMKNPDDDMPKNWEEEASFTADNMNKMIRGEPSQHVFSKKDMNEMKVMDREKVIEELGKKAQSLGDNAFPRKRIKFIDIRSLFHHDPDQAPNFIQANED